MNNYNNNNNNINNTINRNKNYIKKEPIAIVGIGCRFPGNVTNYNDYVNVIKNGLDCLTKIPTDRWNTDVIARKQSKLNNRIGGFLENIDQFDNQFFGISPKESQHIDPQQRLLLHLAIETLEDGKISLDEIKGSNLGVFIGSSSNDYLRGFDTSEINQFTTPGTNPSFLSNRLSYFLDVNGPSMTINTACSASMVAIHLGLQSIWNGECNLAMVGGVNIINSPLQSLDFGKSGLLNQEIDGRCYSFDPKASGYVRSEGGGILLLKPLSKALENNDDIYSVFLNSGNNSNGKTHTGITSPRSICQEKLIESIIKEINLDYNNIGYFECHGTGTQMGDFNEIMAIGKSIGIKKSIDKPLIIGSVKSSIGHLEGASGIAGVIKTIICIKEKIFPQQCKFSGYNPKIPFETLNLRVLTKTQPWHDNIRIAGVNSFGVGGSNSNLFLSSIDHHHQQSNKINSLKSTSSSTFEVITISVTSSNMEDLKLRANDILKSINEDILIKDLSFTTTMRTSHYSNRVAIIGNTTESIKNNIKSFIDDGDEMLISNKSIILPAVDITPVNNSRICLVFSGQGQQYKGMLFDLFENNLTFRNEVNNFSELFEKLSGWSIIDKLYNSVCVDSINETWLAQPSIVAIQFGIIKILKEIGVPEASVVTGHSLGELTAAFYSGIISIEDTIKLLWIRSYLQNKTTGSGRMYVVLSSKIEIEKLINQYNYQNKIVISGNNTNKSCTISGDNQSMDEFTSLILSNPEVNITLKQVKTKSAFHSHQMDQIKNEFYSLFNQHFNGNLINCNINSSSNTTSFYSTCYGKQLTSLECKQLLSSPDYWWKNIRDSVLFKETIDSIIQNHQPFINCFIEISAHPILNYFINQIIKSSGERSKSIHLYSVFTKDTNSIDNLLLLSSKLYVNNIIHSNYNIKLWNWYYNNKTNYVTIKLPGRRWKFEKYWIENNQRQLDRIDPPKFSSLDKRLFSVTPSFEVRLNQDRLQYLKDHVIQSIPLIPFTFYLELIYASIAELSIPQQFEIINFTIDNSIIIDPKNSIVIGINFNSDSTKFEIGSNITGTTSISHKWKIHASGKIKYNSNYLKSSTPIQYPTSKSIKNGFISYNSNEFYKEISKFDYNYKIGFQCLKEFKQIDKDTYFSLIEFPNTVFSSGGEYINQLPIDFRSVHPCLMDAVLQTAIIPSISIIKGLWVPVKIGSISINLPKLPSNHFNFKDQLLYCKLKSNSYSQLIFSVDIQVFDKKTNNLICELIDLQFKAISKQQEKYSQQDKEITILEDVKQQHYYHDLPLISQYKWSKEELINQSIKFTDNYQTIIFCSTNLNDNDLLEGIISSSIENGHDSNKIFIVSPPPIENDQFNNRIIINYSNQESDFDSLFAITNINQNITNRFIILPNFNCITTNSGNSTPNQESINDSGGDDNEDSDGDFMTRLFNDSNISLFHLEKAIMKNNIRGRLFLITNGGQSIGSSNHEDKQLINLSQYQLIGQIRVFSNEYPRIECSMIDIQDSTKIDLITEQLNSTKLSKWELSFRDNIAYSYQLLVPDQLVNNKCKNHQTSNDYVNSSYYKVEISNSGILSDLVIKQHRQMIPNDNEVLVKVEMATLNFRDILKSLGRDYDAIHLNSIGDEFSGKVIEIGKNVKHLTIGQNVFGIDMSNSMGSFVCCNSDLVFPIPTQSSEGSNLNSNSYSTIPIVFLTAWYSLIIKGQLKPNDKVLIHSACGGVGLASIQICKMIGVIDIYVTVGSDEKKQYLIKEFNLDESKIYSSRSLQFYNDVMINTDGQGVDLVLNSLSGEYLEKSIKCLSPYGRFIEIGKKDIYSNFALYLEPFKNNLTFYAVDIAQMTINRRSYLRDIMVNDLLIHFKNGFLKPLDQTIFNHNEIIKAIRLMSSGNHIGKILINWSNLSNLHHDSYVKVIDLPIKSSAFTNNSTYIFTGMGGVCQTLLKYYSVNSDIKNAILVSKNGLDNLKDKHGASIKSSFIKLLKDNGVNVKVEKCDISSSQQVDKLFNRLVNHEGYNIKGIFHLASLINDERINKHNEQSFNYVFNSKAISAWNLHKVSIKYKLSLDHFQTIGSVTTVIGNIGQCNYTAANRFVEGLTHLRNGMGLSSTCIHLASVPEIGMASKDCILNNLNSMGFTPFKTLDEMNLGFKYLLNNSDDINLNIVVLGEINTDRFIATTPNFRGKDNFIDTSLLSRCNDKVENINERDDIITNDNNEEEVNNQSNQTTYLDDGLLISNLRCMVCDILELKDRDLNNSISFNEYGLDSLLSSELSNVIQKKYGILVPSLTLVDNCTILSTTELIKAKTSSSRSSLSRRSKSPLIRKETTVTQPNVKIINSPPEVDVNEYEIKKQQRQYVAIESLPSIKPLSMDLIKLNQSNEFTSPPSAKKNRKEKGDDEFATVIYEISPVAAPYHRLQRDVLKEVLELTNDQKQFITNIYNKSKIRSRYCFNDFSSKSMLEINKMEASERVNMFKEQTYQTVVNAGKLVIEKSGIDPMLISHVVGVTSTGIMAPSIDVVLIDRLGLSINTSRTMINFMGCGAAVNSMRAAAAYAKSKPGTYVLVVAIEASATCMKFDFESRHDLLSQCIFTDGCVGTLITCQPRSRLVNKLEIIDDLSYLMPDSRDALNLFIGSTGIDLDLSPELPIAINRHIKTAITQWLSKNNLQLNDIEFYATHPGGAKIITAVHEGLGLSPEDLSDSYDVLKRYGNMISASTYYVLRRILEKNNTLIQEGSLGFKYGIAMAFSPGSSIEAILLKLIKE